MSQANNLGVLKGGRSATEPGPPDGLLLHQNAFEHNIWCPECRAMEKPNEEKVILQLLFHLCSAVGSIALLKKNHTFFSMTRA